MTNQELAQIFLHIADILDIQGENPFKVRAYKKAAETLENFPQEISSLENFETLQELPGIGQAISQKIKELMENGKLKYYEELKASEYAPLTELLKIPGMGPKHIKLVYDKLKIKTVEQLEKKALQGKLRDLPGLGEKTEQNILKGIAQVKKFSERFPLGYILPKAQEIEKELRELKEVNEILLCGSLRRMKETIADVDILISSNRPKPVAEKFVALSQVKAVISQGKTKASISSKYGFQVDLRVVKPESFGSAAHYFTGSKSHNIKIRSRGVAQGLKINEYGVFKGQKRIAGKTEEEVYASVGFPYFEPELREDRGEIEAALQGKLPHLIQLKDLKGDLHTHSNWTDGHSSIEEMAKKGLALGYEYIAMCDHSPTIGITNGLDEKKLEKHNEEIDKLNKRFKNFRVLKGIEVDIRSDGKLDLPDSVLEKLEVVVGAVHTKFTLSKEEMTKRIIKAIEDPNVDIIAHPTGRLIGKREPYEVDMDKIIDAAYVNKKVLELNAYPDRLDLNDLDARKAKNKGIKVAINTDAHRDEHLNLIFYGIATAKRGWLEPSDVINTYPLKKLLEYLKK
jgi:DNA polymerase (family 10)